MTKKAKYTAGGTDAQPASIIETRASSPTRVPTRPLAAAAVSLQPPSPLLAAGASSLPWSLLLSAPLLPASAAGSGGAGADPETITTWERLQIAVFSARNAARAT